MDYFSNIINGLPEFQKANVILELGAGSFGRTIQFIQISYFIQQTIFTQRLHSKQCLKYLH